MNVGDFISGFSVKRCVDLPDVEGRMWCLVYEKNGAEVVWLERQDEVKTFVIAFKTLPDDDTGVAHILEHSVLDGSRKFPVKSPFDEINKSSLKVFANAMTYSDKTCYPFATRNDVDFLNLADVYLDAVFHPLAIVDPKAFMQEGWHYELSPSDGSLIRNGVVLNEMKGAFASPVRCALAALQRGVFAKTSYGYVAGGHPEAIPELTWGKYKAFYSKHYHPSNAKIFLDGSVDLCSILKKLDGYLREFEGGEKTHDGALVETKTGSVEEEYAAQEVENRTIYCCGWLEGKYTERCRARAFSVLSRYLCGSNASPLKKALLERGLCENAGFGSQPGLQRMGYFVVHHTSPEKIAECKRVARETCERILADGFDARRLSALIDDEEFAAREINCDRPRGLTYFERAAAAWMYGGDPAERFDLSGIFSGLRAGIVNGFYAKMLRECGLVDGELFEVTLKPRIGFAERRQSEERKMLGAIKSGMTESALAKVREESALLKAWQSTPDTLEALGSIPRFKLEDIPAEGEEIYWRIDGGEEVVRIHSKSASGGVVYVSVYFPVDSLSGDDMLALPMLMRLFGRLRTSRHSALDLQTALASAIGRYGFGVASKVRGNYAYVTFAALQSKIGSAVQLIREILLETQYEDHDAIGNILKQKVTAMEQEAAVDGRRLARRYAARGMSRRDASLDCFHGLTQLRWLQKAKAEGLQCDFAEISRRVFGRRGMVLSATDNIPESAVAEIVEAFPLKPHESARQSVVPLCEGGKAGFRIPADTGFASWIARMPEGARMTGAMLVAARLLSRGYLHNEVREQGGAYGVGVNVYVDGTVKCYSYRDPSPVESLAKFSKIGTALRRFCDSGEDLSSHIVATIAAMEPYRSPSDEAARSVGLYLGGRTPDDVKLLRREVLSTAPRQLLDFADMLDEISSDASTCVVGGDRQLATLVPESVEPVVR